MNVFNKTVFISSLLIGLGACGQGFISEIINNTDEEITVQCKEGNAKFNVVKSYLLSDGTETQPRIQKSVAYVLLAPRTRNIFTGLKIPMFNVADGHWDLIHSAKETITMYFNGKKYRANPRNQMPYGFSIRQYGDLLQFANGGTCLSEMHLPNGSIVGKFQLNHHSVTAEKINNGNPYSIEINAINTTPLHVKISKVVEDPVVIETVRPTAQTVDFIDFNQQQSITKAVIGFDKIIGNDFFTKFLDLIKKNDFFSRVGKMSIKDAGKRELLFDLYTKITKEEFQEIVNQMNQTPL